MRKHRVVCVHNFSFGAGASGDVQHRRSEVVQRGYTGSAAGGSPTAATRAGAPRAGTSSVISYNRRCVRVKGEAQEFDYRPRRGAAEEVSFIRATNSLCASRCALSERARAPRKALACSFT